MYILTNRLVALRDALPLPWYHRAPLGLMSGTPVHVALQASRSRPFGDLLVSVIDPVNWRFVSEVSVSRADAPGVLADVYKAAPPLNIVFAEAVTVDSGSRHDARLVLEPFYPRPDEDVGANVKAQMDALKKSLRELGFNPQTKRMHPRHDDLTWMDIGTIELGWVDVDGWREAVMDQARESDEADKYDLYTAVISADTERRTLRYVFPRRGAVSVSVTHSDRPGAMGEIAEALADRELNILSSLLRRGSAPAQKAEVVVVVEPTDETIDASEVERRAHDALDDLSLTLRVRVKVSRPIDPENAVLYPRRPHEIAVRPSVALEAAIRQIRRSLPQGERKKRLIFISRRFVDLADRYNREVVEELRDVLREYGLVALEATPQPGADRVASDEVKAKMWASDAAILLVVSAPNEREFSENLAHECGFMQGQGKSLLPLVQEDVSDSITRIANLQGLQLSTFSRESAMNRRRPNSIREAVHSWVVSQFPDVFADRIESDSDVAKETKDGDSDS
jgi:predicted amino acid-binding ACT domain protein